MSKRAQRRHHYQRLKKKVRFYYGGDWNRDNNDTIPWDDDACGGMVETRPACSCDGCGNPRRKELRPELQLTIQERRAFQDSIGDMIEEYFINDEEST